ncbi:HepT-like ribonuclease domain-containing protein [Oerskovia sp. M15]
MRLLEIGEAVKALSPELTAREPEIPWTNIAGMRDFLAHHYFATNPEIVQAVIDNDLRPWRRPSPGSGRPSPATAPDVQPSASDLPDRLNRA